MRGWLWILRHTSRGNSASAPAACPLPAADLRPCARCNAGTIYVHQVASGLHNGNPMLESDARKGLSPGSGFLQTHWAKRIGPFRHATTAEEAKTEEAETSMRAETGSNSWSSRPFPSLRRSALRVVGVTLGLLGLAACAAPPPTDPDALAEYKEANDKYEKLNRKAFA